MHKAERVLALILLGLLAALWLPLGAMAAGKTGSVTITMKDTDAGTPIPGGSLRCRLVAQARDGVWVPTPDFAPAGLSLADPAAPALARGLADWAASKALPGTDRPVGKDARVVFSGLGEGLYLITQPVSAEGYEPIVPFLVSIPLTTEAGTVYDVDAAPKTEVRRTPAPPPPQPERPPRLPQTGQLWWPVGLCAGLGLLLVVLGLVRRRRDR